MKTLEEFTVSPRVKLAINTGKIADKEFIPKDIDFADHRKPLEQVAIAMNAGWPVLLEGATGSGKTSLVRHLAHKTGNAFVRINLNGGTTVEDLVGRWLIDEKGTKWVDGLLTDALKKGYWVLFDEINAASAEILFILHQLLDDDARIVLVEKGKEVVVPAEGYRFFASMNPMKDYAGTKELNPALKSRFCIVKVEFCPPDVEAEILVTRTGIALDVAKSMVKFAVEIRANDKMIFPLSTRDLIMWASVYPKYNKFIPSAEVTVVNKAGEDDIQAVQTILGAHFMVPDSKTTADGKAIGIGTKVVFKSEFPKAGGQTGTIVADVLEVAKKVKASGNRDFKFGKVEYIRPGTDFGVTNEDIEVI